MPQRPGPDLHRLRVAVGEAAAIDGIPADILETLERAQAEFAAAGGCPSCGSTVLGVHEAHCKTGKDDLY